MLMALLKSRLSLRLVMASLIISSVLSVFSTGIQLYYSYETQKREAFASLQLVKETVSDPLSRGLWEFNLDIVQAILEGIAAGDFISAVSLDTPTGHAWQVGPLQPDRFDATYPLLYAPPGDAPQDVGTISFALDFSKMQQRIWAQLWTTLAANITKAYLAALGMLLVFHLLVTRHLLHIARHLGETPGTTARQGLVLPRLRRAPQDELDTVAAAVNKYEERISRHFSEMEREIEDRKQAEASATEALSVRTVFLTTLSHEIRTPLNAILGLLHLIEISPDSAPKTRRHAQAGLAAGQNLLEMLTNTLEAARLEANAVEFSPSRTNIRALADHWLETGKAAVHRRGKCDAISVTLEMHPDLAAHYRLDGARVSQVVGNLTDNAAKFTSSGQICIGVSLCPQDKPVPAAQLAVSVRDTGSGIPGSKRQLVFDRFRQVDQGLNRQHDGSGLGLSISSGIAELMGGSLELLEPPSDGFSTEFLLLLPTEAITKEPADA